MKMDLNKTAKIFIEAFDMDMQIFLKNVNRQLAHTAGGQSIIMWAKSNPIKFNALLHMISIAIQQIPDAGGILITIVKSQLVRLGYQLKYLVLLTNTKTYLLLKLLPTTLAHRLQIHSPSMIHRIYQKTNMP